MGLYDYTFYHLIKRNALCFGKKTAWFEVDDSRDITFEHYGEMVDRLSAGLAHVGVKKGDRIGVLGHNSLEYFLLYGAAAALGAIMLPVNRRLSGDEIVYILNDGAPDILFVDREFEALAGGIGERLGSVKHYYNLKPGRGGYADFGTLLDNPGKFEEPEVSPEDGFVIIHTAAVEGRPRGALLSHGNILWANLYFNYLFNLGEGDAHLNILTLFHVAGLFMATCAFQAGVPSVNMSRFDAEQAARLIEEKKITLIFVFSPILSSILEQQERTGARLDSLRSVIGIDSIEIIEKYQELTGGTFFTMYGQTETSCLGSAGRYDDRPGAAGKVIPMAEITLVDDYDEPVLPGAVGEIVMRGPMVFKGYWNLPEDTKRTFRSGMHHTGDLGRFDEEGYLFYAGRKAEKELIKPGGENVYPAEVEKVLLQHPAVANTVVFGVPDPRWKEGIKAVCLLKPGETLDAPALIDFVGERIARYKKPGYVDFTTDFPLLEDGTPDRELIKKRHG